MVALRGPDIVKLVGTMEALRDKTRSGEVPGVVDADVALRLDKPEFRIHVDRDRAADLGVDTTDVATSHPHHGGRRRPGHAASATTAPTRTTTSSSASRRSTAATPTPSRGSTCPPQAGGLVRLDNVVRIEQGLAPSRIERLDRQRSVRLFAGVGPGYALGDRVTALRKALADMNLPAAYSVTVLGRGREMERTFAEFGMAFLLSIAFMYMILASQFESLADPLTILISLPLAVPFALFSLWATSDTLNLYSALGVLVLFGIVKKNSILQIDHMNNLRRQHGLSRDEAVMQGNRDRLRPILMTTLALVAGMLPLAPRHGPGGRGAPLHRHRGHRRADPLAAPDPPGHAGLLHPVRGRGRLAAVEGAAGPLRSAPGSASGHGAPTLRHARGAAHFPLLRPPPT